VLNAADGQRFGNEEVQVRPFVALTFVLSVLLTVVVADRYWGGVPIMQLR